VELGQLVPEMEILPPGYRVFADAPVDLLVPLPVVNERSIDDDSGVPPELVADVESVKR
jgi:hypothetical protein